MSSTPTYFSFREAETAAEMKSMLQLRYRGYLASRCAGFMQANPHGLDLDAYDLQARHFGLFQYEGSQKTVVGYMRLAQDSVSPQLKEIWQLSMHYPDLINDINFSSEKPYPIMGHLHQTAPVMDYYHHIKKQGETLVEASRMVIEADRRSSMGLSKFMIDSALSIGLFSSQKYDHCILGCSPAHRRYYERFGFSSLHTDFYDHLSCEVLTNTAEGVQGAAREQSLKMADAYNQHKALFYYPNNANQFTPIIHIPAPGQYQMAV